MIFSPQRLLAELQRVGEGALLPERVVCAVSGGLDSIVLLHTLHLLRKSGELPFALSAIHVDHGLQESAAEWSQFCAEFAKQRDLPLTVVAVDVDRNAGLGLEAAARNSRYKAFAATLKAGDWLLTAHHRDDNAETLLMHLVRGSGPRGLAGIKAKRRLGKGYVVRPLLEFGRDALEAFAAAEHLNWRNDPSNSDVSLDRNYVRHKILPQFETRWPDIAARLSRSARHLRSADEVLEEVATRDLAEASTSPERLRLDVLEKLSPARRANCIRRALSALSLPSPTTRHVDLIETEVIAARDDAQPTVHWPGVNIRRYRRFLYLMADTYPSGSESPTFVGDQCRLGADLGVIRLRPDQPRGLDPALAEAGLRVSWRKGGESIKPYGQSHTRELKKLLQEHGVVPWLRNWVPLLFAGDRLVAVADLWIANDAVVGKGVGVEWQGRPTLQ